MSWSADKRLEKGSRALDTLYASCGKRIFDFLAASLGLLITSPILFLCIVAIKLDSCGPVFYRQWRVGKGGKLFRIVKLRTMVQGADQQGPRLTSSSDARITRVGRWLRKTKIDEIPQLLNVLRGEMSLVGPRPEVPEYVATYSPEQRKVLEARPGMTGPAALTFIDEEGILRSSDDPESLYVSHILARKLELDLAYSQNMTFYGDLRLIFGTIPCLLKSASRTKLDARV